MLVRMRRTGISVLALCCVLIGAVSCGKAADPPRSGAAPEQLRVQVLSTRLHDPTSFTEGLELDGRQLYESTGLEGHSLIERSDASTATVQASVALPPDLFGEGVTVAGDTLWQLTWRNGFAIRRDPQTLADRGHVPFTGEGWGLCHQPGRLVMSNGTDTLTFRDPATFAETGTIQVHRQGQPLDMLNELECVDGAVWANVWQTDQIVRIDPATGQVTATVDVSGLLDRSKNPSADVLNGIAAIPGTDRFLITGKLWPTTFEVRFVPDRDAP
jgi:glutamine cyclotransferase